MIKQFNNKQTKKNTNKLQIDNLNKLLFFDYYSLLIVLRMI